MKQHRTKQSRTHTLLHSRLLQGLIVLIFAGIGTVLFMQSRVEAPDFAQVTGGGKLSEQRDRNGSAAKTGASAAINPPVAKPAPPPPAGPSRQAPQPPVATPKPAMPTPVPAPATGTSRKVKITLYGAYDNDPAGSRAIAHPVIHQLAGGTGSYADPLTFASPSGAGEYPWGQIIYVPAMQKYFIREDSCGVSWTAPNGCGGVDMVDLYIGNPSDSQNVTACEEALTPDGNAEIIVNPAANLVYDAAPLWNQATGTCARLD